MPGILFRGGAEGNDLIKRRFQRDDSVRLAGACFSLQLLFAFPGCDTGTIDTIITPIADCAAHAECADGNSCTSDQCVLGKCVNKSLLDGTFCGDGAACFDGFCRESTDTECLQDEDCSDESSCTFDVCANGLCMNIELPDGSICGTDGFVCSKGFCRASPDSGECHAHVDCDDDNPCTSDVCDNGFCINEILPDGTVCFVDGSCLSGLCKPDTLPACRANSDCVDDNPCTGDLCLDDLCVNTAFPDGTWCEQDATCRSGYCRPDDIVSPGCVVNAECADDNPCTSDYCVDRVCMNAVFPDGTVCGDQAECAEGFCRFVNEKECIDRSGCPSDEPCASWDCVAFECVRIVFPDGTSCGDEMECTAGECVALPCQPDCFGIDCGPDPVCGQSCGTCDEGSFCHLGRCLAQTCDPGYFLPGSLNTLFEGDLAYPGTHWFPIVWGGHDQMLLLEYSKYSEVQKWRLGNIMAHPLSVEPGNYLINERFELNVTAVGHDGNLYSVGRYSSSGRDEMLFDRYDLSSGTHVRTVKEWYPTSAFSDNDVLSIRKTAGGAVYMMQGWRYRTWSDDREDVYFARSDDNMADWSAWIQAPHIGLEGSVIAGRSAVVDSNDVMWVALTTTWDGGSQVVMAFDGTNVVHSDVVFKGAVPAQYRTASVIFLNLETGRLAVLYLDESGVPNVRYNNVQDYGPWSTPEAVDPCLAGGIHLGANSEMWSPGDRDRFYAVWNSLDEMVLLEWDGNTGWTQKAVPKFFDYPFWDGRVHSLSDGQPLVLQTYIPGETSAGYLVALVDECVLAPRASRDVAIINPDFYRTLKYGGHQCSSDVSTMWSLPAGESMDSRNGVGGADLTIWSGLGAQTDWLTDLLTAAGRTVVHLDSLTLKPSDLMGYRLVIVQDPMRTAERATPLSRIDSDMNGLLASEFPATATGEIARAVGAGQHVVFVGRAVSLLPALGLGFTTVDANVVPNTGATGDEGTCNELPHYWVMVAGHPFCCLDRAAEGVWTVAGTADPFVESIGTVFSTVTMLDQIDLYRLFFSETFYSPADGIPLIYMNIAGGGDHVRTESVCNPTNYPSQVNTSGIDFAGYAVSGQNRVFYLSSDALFDYFFRGHAGDWHCPGQTATMTYEITEAGRALIRDFLAVVQDI